MQERDGVRGWLTETSTTKNTTTVTATLTAFAIACSAALTAFVHNVTACA